MVVDLSVSQTIIVIPSATINMLISVLLLSRSPKITKPKNADSTGETASMSRVIATVVVKDGIVVQSINFKKFLPVGKPHIAIEYLNSWGIDEIILLDISATKKI